MSDPTCNATQPPDASTGDVVTATGDAAAAIRDLVTDTGATFGAAGATGGVDAPPGFAIEKELGVGGMGVVYLARQQGLNRLCALKLVKGGPAVDMKALIRFLAEAEAVAAIRHPHVVEVFQYGEHRGQPYLALEFCPGGDLTSLTKGERTRDASWFRRVAELMAAVADGVNAAHAQGIVHRDLKPHNVFLAADGTPKVADFGLAKRGTGSDLTQTDAVMGTPAYMSPEQAGGGTKFVGPEADVWALGVMLYELCGGERPIDTSGPILDAIAKVANAAVPPLRTACPTVPNDLALITGKCLSKDSRDRYATAGALASDLRNWLAGKAITARPAGVIEQAVKWARRNKKLAAMGAAVAVSLVGGSGASVAYAARADRSAAEARVALEERNQAEEREQAARKEAAEKQRQVIAKVIAFVSERPTLLPLDRGLFIDAFHAQFPEVGKRELIATIASVLLSDELESLPTAMPSVGASPPAVERSEPRAVRRTSYLRMPTSPLASLTGFSPMAKNLAEISDVSEAFARQSEGGTQVAQSYSPNMFGD